MLLEAFLEQIGNICGVKIVDDLHLELSAVWRLAHGSANKGNNQGKYEKLGFLFGLQIIKQSFKTRASSDHKGLVVPW